MNPLAYGGSNIGTAREQLFYSDALVHGVRRVIAVQLQINVNSANTDTIVPLQLLPGTNFIVRQINFNNASTSLTTATIGVFTGAGGTGTTVMANAALSSLTTATTNFDATVAAGAQALVLNQATLANPNNLYIRVGTAQGAAATVDCYIWADILP
jgi:hypothetical protein